MTGLRTPSRFPAAGFLFSVRIFIPSAILLGLLFVNIPATAELAPRLFGTVTDTSGLPLAGAHITITDLQSGAVSDWDGRYFLHNLPPGSYTLIASHLGYEPRLEQDVVIHEDVSSCVNFVLKPITLTRPDVEVTTGYNPIYSALDQKITIPGASWRSSGAASVGDVLREVPGVTVMEGDNSQRISLRGSPTRTVRVDLDGIPLNDAGTGEAEVGSVDLDQIAAIQIEFEGMGGKVHLKTTDLPQHVEKANSLSTSLTHGSYGCNELGVSCDHQQEKLSVGGLYKRKISAGDFSYRLDNDSQHRRINNHSSSSSGIVKAMFTDEVLQLDGGIYYEDFQRGVPGLICEPPTPEASLSGERLSARLALKGNIVRINNEVTGYVSDYTGRYTNPPLQDNPAAGTVVHRVAEDNRQTGLRYGLTTNSGLELKQGKLHLGYSFQKDRYRGEDLLRGLATIGGVGFGDAERTVNRIELDGRCRGKITGLRCHLNPGMAVEWIDDKGKGVYSTTSPSISAALERLFKMCRMSLASGWGRSLSAPPFNALFLVENTFAVGNKDLRPERGETFFAGLIFSSTGSTDGLHWRIGLTHTRRAITDLIIWRRNFHGKYYPDNIDRVKARGIEINGSTSVLSGLVALSGTYVYDNSVNDTPGDINYGKRTPFLARDSGSASVIVRKWKMSLSLSGRWVGRRYSTESNTDPMSTAGMGLPPYEVYDCSLSRDFTIWRIVFSGKISVDNLLDRSYRVVERSPMPGRMFAGKLVVSL